MSNQHPWVFSRHLSAATPADVAHGEQAVILTDVFEGILTDDPLVGACIVFTDAPFLLDGELTVNFAVLDRRDGSSDWQVRRAHELGLVPDELGRWNDRYTVMVFEVRQV